MGARSNAAWCRECSGWGEWVEDQRMRCCPSCNGAGLLSGKDSMQPTAYLGDNDSKDNTHASA